MTLKIFSPSFLLCLILLSTFIASTHQFQSISSLSFKASSPSISSSPSRRSRSRTATQYRNQFYQFNQFPSSTRKPLLQHPTFSSRSRSPTTTPKSITAPKSTQSTSLNSLVLSTIGGGFFAGGLHAISGPDHLAALLPKCISLRSWRALRVGTLWGLGHGCSATILGAGAYALKNRLNKVGRFRSPFSALVIANADKIMNIAVGLSLIIIGILGIREANEYDMESDTGRSEKMKGNRAIMFNGLLHGFNWGGAPSLAPSLAATSWRGSLSFLISYGLGTMAAMGIATMVIGEGAAKFGEKIGGKDGGGGEEEVVKRLSFYSSVFAVVVGVFWTATS